MTDSAPVPLYILCGPLGAGKTTLLLRLLEHWGARGTRVGVLMNEAGAISVDGARAAMLAPLVRNMTGGCVCCDAREEILKGLLELVSEQQSEVVILECSGMANIEDVVEAVTDSQCRALVTLTKVIAVVEPVVMQIDRTIGTRYTGLVRYADEIVLNKQDLYAPLHWERFRAALVRDNRQARLWQTTSAGLSLAALLAPRHRRTQIIAGANVSFGSPRRHPMVVTVPLPRPMNRGRFAAWFKRLPEGVERAKGLCRFSDSEDLYEVQFSSPVTRWVGIVRLQHEPDPALVLIGRDYDQVRCCRTLQDCLCPA